MKASPSNENAAFRIGTSCFLSPLNDRATGRSQLKSQTTQVDGFLTETCRVWKDCDDLQLKTVLWSDHRHHCSRRCRPFSDCGGSCEQTAPYRYLQSLHHPDTDGVHIQIGGELQWQNWAFGHESIAHRLSKKHAKFWNCSRFLVTMTLRPSHQGRSRPE